MVSSFYCRWNNTPTSHLRPSTYSQLILEQTLKLLLAFAVPLMLGSLFQQFYNLADTIIVKRLAEWARMLRASMPK